MAFAPIKRWKLPYITRWESFQNRNPPIISADEVTMHHPRGIKFHRRSWRNRGESSASDIIGQVCVAADPVRVQSDAPRNRIVQGQPPGEIPSVTGSRTHVNVIIIIRHVGHRPFDTEGV